MPKHKLNIEAGYGCNRESWFYNDTIGIKAAYGVSDRVTMKSLFHFPIDFYSPFHIKRLLIGPALKIVTQNPFRANFDFLGTYNFNYSLRSFGFTTGPNIGLYTRKDIFFIYTNRKLDFHYGTIGGYKFMTFSGCWFIHGLGIGFTILNRVEIKGGINLSLPLYYYRSRTISTGPWDLFGVMLVYEPVFYGVQIGGYFN